MNRLQITALFAISFLLLGLFTDMPIFIFIGIVFMVQMLWVRK